jgi:hypothetical protein
LKHNELETKHAVLRMSVLERFHDVYAVLMTNTELPTCFIV